MSTSTSRKSSSKPRSRLTRRRAATLTPEQIAQIGSLLARIAALEERVKSLESERPNRLGPAPVNPGQWSPFPWRDDIDTSPYTRDPRLPPLICGDRTDHDPVKDRCVVTSDGVTRMVGQTKR